MQNKDDTVLASSIQEFEEGNVDTEDEDEIDIDTIRDVASFSFDGPDLSGISSTTTPATENSNMDGIVGVEPIEEDSGAIPLPDIKDSRRRKEMEQELARIQEEELEKTKIDRSDRTALLKVRSL